MKTVKILIIKVFYFSVSLMKILASLPKPLVYLIIGLLPVLAIILYLFFNYSVEYKKCEITHIHAIETAKSGWTLAQGARSLEELKLSESLLENGIKQLTIEPSKTRTCNQKNSQEQRILQIYQDKLVSVEKQLEKEKRYHQAVYEAELLNKEAEGLMKSSPSDVEKLYQAKRILQHVVGKIQGVPSESLSGGNVKDWIQDCERQIEEIDRKISKSVTNIQ